MNTDTDIWVSFAGTFGMLFVVLGLFVLAFYMFRRFSGATLGKGAREIIKVIAVHHLSPKEKLVLVSVLDDTILLGVTPSGISKLADIDDTSGLTADMRKPSAGFQDLLGRALKKSGTSESSDPGTRTLSPQDKKGEDHV